MRGGVGLIRASFGLGSYQPLVEAKRSRDKRRRVCVAWRLFVLRCELVGSHRQEDVDEGCVDPLGDVPVLIRLVGQPLESIQSPRHLIALLALRLTK
jgi:hypothetical protein